MIRVLIPQFTYNEHRIKLVQRIMPLVLRQFEYVRRQFAYQEQDNNKQFYEGFLESEERLKLVEEMLSDFPHSIRQDDMDFGDMATFLIEDMESNTY